MSKKLFPDNAKQKQTEFTQQPAKEVGTYKVLPVKMSAAIHRQLKLRAVKEGTTMQEVVLNAYLATI